MCFNLYACSVRRLNLILEQNTESNVSKNYVGALRNVLDHGVCHVVPYLTFHAHLLRRPKSFMWLLLTTKSSRSILDSSRRPRTPGFCALCILIAMHTSTCAITAAAMLMLTICFSSSDFLSNLLILLIRIMNAGLSDRGLLAHLSEATAGTLSGVGHSTAYEEPATYS